MPNAIKNIVRYVAALIAMAVFALLSMNQIQFKHSHIDAHGHIHSHSHHYDKSHEDTPAKRHNHTCDCYCALDATHFFTAEDETEIPKALKTTVDRHFSDVVFGKTTCHPMAGAGRAPPCSMLSIQL